MSTNDMDKTSKAGLRAPFRQCKDRFDDADKDDGPVRLRLGLLASNMRYACRHVFYARHLPLSIDAFNNLFSHLKVVVQQGLPDLPSAWQMVSAHYC